MPSSSINTAVSLKPAGPRMSRLIVFLANANFIYAVLRSKKKFESLRTFTFESGQEQIELQNQRRKERGDISEHDNSSRPGSSDGLRSPTSHRSRNAALSDVPEDSGAFTIGDDEDSDDERGGRPTPSQSNSRTPSISSSVDDAVPLQLRGMSEKARGKRPAGTPSFSRQNSVTSLSSPSSAMLPPGMGFTPSAQWVSPPPRPSQIDTQTDYPNLQIETWLPQLPLHTILTLIQELSPQLPLTSTSTSTSPSILQTIRTTQIRGIDPSPIRVHLFEWSPLSLGWYESLLWGFIFTSEMHVSKGTVGVWNGTGIKLFRVQETAAAGPTLTSPRGAVDAVGSNIVQRIGSLNLRGGPGHDGVDGGDGGSVGVADRQAGPRGLTL